MECIFKKYINKKIKYGTKKKSKLFIINNKYIAIVPSSADQTMKTTAKKTENLLK